MSPVENNLKELLEMCNEFTDKKKQCQDYINKNTEYKGHSKLGWYLLTDADVKLEKKNPGIVLTAVFKKYNDNKTAQIKRSRSSVGLPADKLNSKEMSDKLIFFIKDVDENTGDDRKVYDYQPGIGWDGVESSFKKNVITSMYALYYSYAYKKISWIVLQISSGYRNAERQSNAMIDYAHVLRKGLSKEYGYKDSMKLIEHLYANGDFLTYDRTIFSVVPSLVSPVPENYTPNPLAIKQWDLYEKVTNTGEKTAFNYYFTNIAYKRMYNNPGAMKEFLYLWFGITRYLFPHMRHTALDFSKNNESQRDDFNAILTKHGIKAGPPYSTGNFHVSK